ITPQPHYIKPADEAVAEALDTAVKSEDWNSTPVVRLDLPGTANAYRLNATIFAGDSPPGPEAMELLAQQGVATLISIDMHPPDHYEAAAHDLNYVHIPIRHGRLAPADYMRVLRVISYMEGSYYLHAGNNDDRALAIAAMATHVSEFRAAWRVLYLLDSMEFSKEEIALWYASASPLVYKTLNGSRVWPSDFPPALDVPPTIWWMRQFDESFQVLRAARDAGWETPPDAVGTTAAHEAMVVGEMARSWLEANGETANAEMRTRMEEVRARALEMKQALATKNKQTAETSWVNLSNACMNCHREFR